MLSQSASQAPTALIAVLLPPADLLVLGQSVQDVDDAYSLSELNLEA